MHPCSDLLDLLPSGFGPALLHGKSQWSTVDVDIGISGNL